MLIGLFAAAVAACASPTAPPALIGTWHVASASSAIPDACFDATLTFRPDGSFEASSGTLKTHGRFSATGRKDNYRLTLDQLEYSGAENCQGVTASDLRAQTVNVLNLVFERGGRGLRLVFPKARDAYVAYTRVD